MREPGKSTLVSPRLIRRSAWSIDRMTVPARQIAKNTRMSSSISSALPTASVQNRRSSQGIWSPPFRFLQDKSRYEGSTLLLSARFLCGVLDALNYWLAQARLRLADALYGPFADGDTPD
jgi:hypothetical protein